MILLAYLVSVLLCLSSLFCGVLEALVGRYDHVRDWSLWSMLWLVVSLVSGMFLNR